MHHITHARSWLTSVLCIAAAFTLLACSDGPASNDGNNGNNGVCQYDCFEDYRCQDGIVYEKQGGPISCNEAGSAQEAAQICAERDESELRTCTEGCRSDIENISQYPSYTHELCAEDRLAQPGDDCSEDSDCRPSDVNVGPMLCEGGTCVDPAGPEDAGMTEDAGDVQDPEDTAAEDTTTEDTVDDVEDTEDVGDDTDPPEDTSGDADDTGDTASPEDTGGDADDMGQADDTGDATNDDAMD